FMPRSAWVLTAIALIASVPMIWVAAGDAHDQLGVLGWYMFVAVIPSAGAALQPIWVRYEKLPAIYLSLVRVIVVPVISSLVLAVVAGATVLLPPFADRIIAHTTASGFHHYFSDRDGSPLFQAAVLGGLANMFTGMLIAL